MSDYIVPFAIIFAGLIAMVIYVLAIAVNKLASQLTKVNEKLLIMLASKDGNDIATRALVASSKQPTKNLSGIAEKEVDKKNAQKGVMMTMGVQ